MSVKAKSELLRLQVDRVSKMLAPGFDWEKHEDEGGEMFDEEFRRCVKPIETEKRQAGEQHWYPCGSAGLKDTAKGLYRLLWLLQPKQVDFSDMYKTRLLAFESSDGRFAVTAELYKYELALYFYAVKDAVQVAPPAGPFQITCGVPGFDNGARCIDPDGKAFFSFIKRVLETRHEVYGGNNFSV